MIILFQTCFCEKWYSYLTQTKYPHPQAFGIIKVLKLMNMNEFNFPRCRSRCIFIKKSWGVVEFSSPFEFWDIIITWHFHVAGCRFYEIACPLVFQRCLPSFPLPHVEVKPTRVIFLVVYSPFGSSVEPRYIVWFL